MNNAVNTCTLAALCYISTLLGGCFPDETLNWSPDGSVGIMRVDDKLYLVDGTNGQLTPIAVDGGAGLMPDVSADGKQIAYVRGHTYETVEEGMRAVPEAAATTIRRLAAELAEKVLAGTVDVAGLSNTGESLLGQAEKHHPWVIRVMCQAPSPELAKRIGPEKLQECRQCELGANQLVVADRQKPDVARVITTLPVMIYRPRFSPDGRYVAYIVTSLDKDDKAALAVAPLEATAAPVLVREPVAIGYDWRPDSKALAYIKQDGDELLAVIEENVIVDEQGALVAQEIDMTKTDCLYKMMGEGRTTQFAGTLFEPTMHVKYGPEGRVLFSSIAVQIPTSQLDEPQYSLFCYDRLTGTISKILPAAIPQQASQAMNFFSLSPDRRRLLVPLPKNRFAIYELGAGDAVLPIGEAEDLGDEDMPDFLPKWKGNDEITCLVSETSHFLVGEDGEPHQRKEIVVLDVEGKLVKVLSADWPDEAIPSTEDEQPF